MIREEEINKIAEDYTEIECGLKLKLEEDWTVDDITTAFIKGAKWADKNPKSHWINVKDDLPCNHKELISETPKLIHSKNVLTTKNVLVILTYNIGKLVSMVYINNKWEWDCVFKDEIIFWIPIPELPKE